MTGVRGKRRPYVRSTSRWWQRDLYYKHYLAMEFTSILVAVYAFILLAGLYALAQGKTAYNHWIDALGSPVSIVFHVVLIVVFAYHVWTWFRVMPKTLPTIRSAGKVVSQRRITWTGVALATLTNLLVIFIFIGWNQ